VIEVPVHGQQLRQPLADMPGFAGFFGIWDLDDLGGLLDDLFAIIDEDRICLLCVC
jgi:hypothetical protein